MKFVGQGIQKLEPGQADALTDATESISTPHSRSVINVTLRVIGLGISTVLWLTTVGHLPTAVSMRAAVTDVIIIITITVMTLRPWQQLQQQLTLACRS